MHGTHASSPCRYLTKTIWYKNKVELTITLCYCKTQPQKSLVLHSPYPQLQIKHQLIILMPFWNGFPGSLHLARETRVPPRLFLFTIRRRSVAVKHRRFHIIDNIARDVTSFTLRLPNTNPGETLIVINAPSSVNRKPLRGVVGERGPQGARRYEDSSPFALGW